MNKKNILLIVTSDLFVRNYLTTNALNEIQKKYNLFIIASDQISLKPTIEKMDSFSGFFTMDSKVVKSYYNFFNVLMWKERKKSSSFKFRFMRQVGFDCIYGTKGLTKLYRIMRAIGANMLKNRWPIYSMIFGNKFLFKGFYWFYNKKLVISDSLKTKICSIRPDLIILPSAAFSAIDSDVARISNQENIKSLFLIDNWDNLSSKTIFFYKPDYLGVWGEQSKEHAIKIHGFKAENVFIIGTPRFEHYLESNNESQKSYFPFPYVLFVGCAIPFDETSVLQLLDEEISKNNLIYKNLKIVYRPHPWRQKRSRERKFDKISFNNIILDPQLSAHYLNKDANEEGVYFQPDITYYPSLLKNAKFVIGPLTTMLIESLIIPKPTLALVYDDHAHFTNPRNAYKYFTHFKKLDSIQGLQFCEDISYAASEFRKMIVLSENSVEKSKDYSAINYFIDISTPTYNVKLVQLINKII